MQPRDLLAYIIAIHEASYNGEDQLYIYIYTHNQICSLCCFFLTIETDTTLWLLQTKTSQI